MGKGSSTRMNAIAQELLETAVSRFPEDALTPLRKAALKQFASSGFPTRKHEDWKYTNLSHAVDMSNAWLQMETASSPKASLTAAARTRQQHRRLLDCYCKRNPCSGIFVGLRSSDLSGYRNYKA